ncbi:hypothetical protein GMRT_10568 [Giardia muris]|uniref:Uncharacterized protein n=1 Tax=Giardia muris TaxID=5742 RepID=A0A4Z1SYW0_GIAMU|nr:hypothetical protein GMRT_10568 [Giardia muris]|eukprot:TNJ26853.1 hypothetical protein GMRT_10568 [Giardia muris]
MSSSASALGPARALVADAVAAALRGGGGVVNVYCRGGRLAVVTDGEEGRAEATLPETAAAGLAELADVVGLLAFAYRMPRVHFDVPGARAELPGGDGHRSLRLLRRPAAALFRRATGHPDWAAPAREALAEDAGAGLVAACFIWDAQSPADARRPRRFPCAHIAVANRVALPGARAADCPLRPSDGVFEALGVSLAPQCSAAAFVDVRAATAAPNVCVAGALLLTFLRAADAPFAPSRDALLPSPALRAAADECLRRAFEAARPAEEAAAEGAEAVALEGAGADLRTLVELLLAGDEREDAGRVVEALSRARRSG